MNKLTTEMMQAIREYLQEFYNTNDVVFFKSDETEIGWLTEWEADNKKVVIKKSQLLENICHYEQRQTFHDWGLKPYTIDIARLENKILKLA